MASKTPLIDQIIARGAEIMRVYTRSGKDPYRDPPSNSLNRGGDRMCSWAATQAAISEIVTDENAQQLLDELIARRGGELMFDTCTPISLRLGDTLATMLAHTIMANGWFVGEVEELVPNHQKLMRERERVLGEHYRRSLNR